MINRNKLLPTNSALSVMDAIYQRRAVRDYKSRPVSLDTIRMLLDAAVQAPSAMHEQPWTFVVIQEQEVLDRLSETAKELVRKEAAALTSDIANHALHMVNKPDFHVFYNAGTLIVIYSKFHGPFVAADCWLAAENLMLAACANGLGTCVIGFAVAALNTPQWKVELGIPHEMQAIAPLIVGIPDGIMPPVPHKAPEVLVWR